MLEIGSQSTARHAPTPDASAPPAGAMTTDALSGAMTTDVLTGAPSADVLTGAPSADVLTGATAAGAPSAEPCDLVTVPVRQGLEAVDILRRGGTPAVGPVLHDGACDTLGFLVPPGTAAGWDMPGSACTQTSGRGLRIPELPELPEPAGDAPRPAGWLLPPGDTGEVTDPAVLREALGQAARLIEAADGCR